MRPGLGAVVTCRVDGVDDQDRAVGGGHEVGQQQNDDNDGHQIGQRLAEQHRKCCKELIGLGSAGDDPACRSTQFEVNGRAPGHGKPDETHDGRNDHRAQHVLTNRPAFRNTGEEHTDKRRKRDPPCPVEDRPAALPGRQAVARLGAVCGPDREQDSGNRQEVVPHPDEQGGQAEDRRAEYQKEHEQQEAQTHIDVGQPLDPAANPRECREGRRAHDDDQREDQPGGRCGPDAVAVRAEQPVADANSRESRDELLYAEAQGLRDTKHGRDDRHNVDGVTQRTGEQFAEERRERRSDGQRQAAPVGEETQRQPHDRIGGPSGDAPMRVRPDVGCTYVAGGACLRESGDRAGIFRKVIEGFGGCERQHADANACPEHHREPGEVRELRPVVLVSEPESTCSRPERQRKAAQHEEGHDVDVPVVEATENEAVQCAKDLSCLRRECCGPDDQAADEELRGDRNVFRETGVKAGV